MTATKTTAKATYSVTVTIEDETFTETRKSVKVFTHAGVYFNSWNKLHYVTFHTSEALALKGHDGLSPLMVVAVTA